MGNSSEKYSAILDPKDINFHELVDEYEYKNELCFNTEELISEISENDSVLRKIDPYEKSLIYMNYSASSVACIKILLNKKRVENIKHYEKMMEKIISKINELQN